MEISSVLRVRLTPRGGRDAVTRYEGGVLHARVSAPPVDGAANKALIELLSRVLATPRSQISIIGGESAREKTLRISGIDQRQVVLRVQSAIDQVDARKAKLRNPA